MYFSAFSSSGHSVMVKRARRDQPQECDIASAEDRDGSLESNNVVDAPANVDVPADDVSPNVNVSVVEVAENSPPSGSSPAVVVVDDEVPAAASAIVKREPDLIELDDDEDDIVCLTAAENYERRASLSSQQQQNSAVVVVEDDDVAVVSNPSPQLAELSPETEQAIDILCTQAESSSVRAEESNVQGGRIDYGTMDIDYRCDNRRFCLSAHDCQVPIPTSQNPATRTANSDFWSRPTHQFL
jgi:hypothetical protein